MKKEIHIEREIDNSICEKRKVKRILQTATVFKLGESDGGRQSHILLYFSGTPVKV